ncbi:MAG: thioredoxin domain-containing protein [Chthoniobacterales bacterium]
MKRYLPLLIILVVALITAGAATLLYRSKMGAPPAPTTSAPASASASASVSGSASPTSIPPQPDDELAHVRGPANAPVTIEIYGDFQCPACGIATKNLDEVAKDYDGKIRMIFHEFPLAMHAHAVEAAMAAEAAGVQGQFWPMHDMLYQYQSIWSKSTNPARFFVTYAQSLGMNPDQFESDQHSDVLKGRIMTQGDAGVKRGVKNTPTIFINGVQFRGEFSKEVFKSAIDAALAAKGKS